MRATPAPENAADLARERDDRRVRACRALIHARTASAAERRRIRQKVVLEYLDVADAVAHRFRSAHEDPRDLRQVAYIGLTKAVSRYEPERGDDIVAFAVPTISGEIKRYLRDSTWMVRPPRKLQERGLDVSRRISDLGQRLGREPGIGDIERDTGWSRDEVSAALGCLGGRRPVSLDAPSNDASGASLGELMASENSSLSHFELRMALSMACRDLSHRDRLVLRMRFAEEMTQAEIAREIGVTQMQVSRILTRVLSALRERLTPELLAA